MKRKNRFLTIAVLFLLGTVLLTGCQKPQEQGQATPTPDEMQPDAFYTAVVESDARPVAVMIDNDNKAAWPHAGLDSAYLLYEIMVEGGATRMMALFKNAEPEKIGPVRSSRHYFLDYVLENDANYVHSGWSPKAEADIPALGVNNINGIFDGRPFWRENKYQGDYHSLFTSMKNLQEEIGAKGYRTTSDVQHLTFGKKEMNLSSASSVSHVSIPYTEGFYQVDYKYNSDTKTFDRSMNQSPHKLQNDKVVSPKNIIIQFAKNYSLGDGTARQNVETMSGGKGYYLTNGGSIEITWSKAARDKRTVYKDINGTEIMLNPGQTIIQIVPPTAKLILE